MKITIKAGLVAMSLLASQAYALDTTVWNPAANPASTGVWSDSGNWTGKAVPGSGHKVVFNVPGAIPCLLTNTSSVGHLVVGDGGPGSVTVAGGGNLSTVNGNWTGIGFNNRGTLEVQTGGFASINDHLWIGFEPTGDGTIILSGGTASVSGMFGLGWNGGKGTALIRSGTLNLAQWHPTDSIKGPSTMDITRGKVVISGDRTSSVDAFVASGKLTAFGGAGTVDRVFDSEANKTIVTAIRPANAGPFPATSWPITVNPAKKVHYFVADETLSLPNENWQNTLGLLNDGDQVVTDGVVKGFASKRATSSFINLFDSAFQEWNTSERIDILMQVYGDASVLRPNNLSQSRRIQFLTGTVPFEVAVDGGSYETNAYNLKWNWILFSITNHLVGSGPDRKIGSVPPGSLGNVTYGGVNGGTLRLQGPDGNVNNFTIHAVALGEPGAFGEASNINQFEAPDQTCGPIPPTNLVGIDFNGNITNHLQVLNNGNQTVSFLPSVGPEGDRRKAILPNGIYLNFGIPEDYLGKPCHENVTVKICVDFFDDPDYGFYDVTFGPDSYALDPSGATGFIPTSQQHYMMGTGKWIRRSWIISNVNLQGVGTAPLTGGPRLVSLGASVAVSRFEMAILRTGGHPLAGQDPLSDCYSDPLICDSVYGNFAELDLAKNIKNGLDVGSSGGDQNMVVEQAGPANDRRLSVRPAFGDNGLNGQLLNFAILNEALGPNSQPNARLGIAVTYFDDPALAGKGFRPQVWKAESGGSETFNFLQPVHNMVLQGTGQWRDAYWEISAIKFSGVNQGPQAAARFSLEGRIPVSRVRYAVIRPCGIDSGRNLLDLLKPSLSIHPETNGARVSWPYRAPQNLLQSASVLGQPWAAFPGVFTLETNNTQGVALPASQTNQFFRLVIP